MLNVKKVLSGAFFIVFFSAISSIAWAQANCLPSDSATRVGIDTVVDGDTVRLNSGRSVRLLGVNTPELKIRKGAPENGTPEPFAQEARTFLEKLLTDKEIGLVLGAEAEDRYKRLLGHLVIEQQTASEMIMLRGLGWAVAIEPNTELADCLFKAERQARDAKLGIWSKRVMSASSVRQGGFALIQGRVTGVDSTKRYIYLELDNQVAVRFSRKKIGVKQRVQLEASLGAFAETRGWIIDRSDQLKPGSRFKPFLLPITSDWHFAFL